MGQAPRQVSTNPGVLSSRTRVQPVHGGLGVPTAQLPVLEAHLLGPLGPGCDGNQSGQLLPCGRVLTPLRLLDLRVALHVLLDGGGHLSAIFDRARPNLVGNVVPKFPCPLLQRCGTPTVAPDRPIHEVGHPVNGRYKETEGRTHHETDSLATREFGVFCRHDGHCAAGDTQSLTARMRPRDVDHFGRRRRLGVTFPSGFSSSSKLSGRLPRAPNASCVARTEWPRWRRVVKEPVANRVGKIGRGGLTLVGSVSDS